MIRQRAAAMFLAIVLGTASALAQPVRETASQDTTIAVASSRTPDAQSRPSDPWLGRDKALHAAASMGLTLGGQLVLVEGAGLSEGRALPVAAGTTLALGVMKELTDRRREQNPLFSWRDLAADALGVAVAALVVSL